MFGEAFVRFFTARFLCCADGILVFGANGYHRRHGGFTHVGSVFFAYTIYDETQDGEQRNWMNRIRTV